MKNLDRRHFLKKTSLVAAAISILSYTFFVQLDFPLGATYMADFAATKLEVVRAAFVGVEREGGNFSWVQGEQLHALYEKYDHPLYKRLNQAAKGSGHGGMDGIMVYRIVECLQKELPLDQNVYEGCFWSAVAPLSESSVASEGALQPFPDFTRGNWKNTTPLSIIN